MTAPEAVTGIDRVQPTLFTMQVALAATMKSYGVRPGAVIGHSLGEVAAAVVAGALSLEDGVRVICRRSRLMSRIAGAGAMASVELPAQQVLSELTARGIKDVVVAVVASPQSTVIGGATQTVRELVAAWEQRDVMAREVAVDVASHSPQVDPILDELAEVLADITPMTPEVPYYSATLFDPREQPVCDATYWVDNLRHTVRFSAAVQAALEDGYRVFARAGAAPAAHPRRRADRPQSGHAGRRPGRHAARAGAAARAARLAGDLHSAGAAVDFSVLYPDGRLVDAPLPTWTHRRLFLTATVTDIRRMAATPWRYIRCLGSHVRLLEEPERHVWQAEVGTAAQPWLADHQIHNVAALPGAAYCEMALAAARTVLGERCRGPRHPLRGDAAARRRDPRRRRRVGRCAPGVVDFVVETDQDGERARRAAAVHCMPARTANSRPRYDMTPAGCAPAPRRRRRGAAVVRRPRRSVRPGFHRSGRRAHRRRGGRHGAGRGRAAPLDPHAANRLQGAPRAAGRLLPVGRRPSGCPGARQRRAAVAAGCGRLRAHGATRNARYCYTG